MITTTGLGKLRARAATKLKGLTGPAIKRAAGLMADETLAEYRSLEETFLPGPVDDLTEPYKKRKAKKFGSVYPILQASGQMMNSMVHVVKVAKGLITIAVDFRGRRTPRLTNARLAEIHVEGQGTQPKRNFMKLSRGFTTKWTRKFAAILRKG